MIYRILEYLKDWVRGNTLGGFSRSNLWPQVRKEFLKENPTCAVCKKNGTLLNSLNVHHKKPFHKFPELELRFENLIVLCRQDHLSWGHYYSWKSWNEDIEKMAKEWREKVDKRP